jgi:hypothetical protein
VAHKSCIMDKQGYMHARACTRPRCRAHAGTRANAYTHTYVILIAFPWQQWLRERASMLRCMYITTVAFYVWTCATVVQVLWLKFSAFNLFVFTACKRWRFDSLQDINFCPSQNCSDSAISLTYFAVELNSSIFCVITWCKWGWNRRFGTTYRFLYF